MNKRAPAGLPKWLAAGVMPTPAGEYAAIGTFGQCIQGSPASRVFFVRNGLDHAGMDKSNLRALLCRASDALGAGSTVDFDQSPKGLIH